MYVCIYVCVYVCIRRKAQEKAAYQEQEQKARLARKEAIAGGMSASKYDDPDSRVM